MANLMYFVDSGMDVTVVHRFDLNKGKYLSLKEVFGRPYDVARKLLDVIKAELLGNDVPCAKVIFDESGFGIAVKDEFDVRIKYDKFLESDVNGDISVKFNKRKGKFGEVYQYGQ